MAATAASYSANTDVRSNFFPYLRGCLAPNARALDQPPGTAVGRYIRIEAALAHGGPPCRLRLRSVGVAPRSASFTRDVYVGPNEAF